MKWALQLLITPFMTSMEEFGPGYFLLFDEQDISAIEWEGE